MVVLRSTLFALVFYGGTVPLVFAALAAAVMGARPMRRVVRGWARFHRWSTEAILGIRHRVEGTIPDYPVLYAIKHESMYETIEVVLLFHEPGILVKQELIAIPLWGRAARIYGAVSIDRDGGASALRKLVREARAIAGQGRPLVIFPEGTRVAHGARAPLRSGFAGLYRQIGLPVVPVAVDSGRVWPRNSFLKRPGVVTFRFGDVIQPGLDRDTVEVIVHAEINRLNA